MAGPKPRWPKMDWPKLVKIQTPSATLRDQTLPRKGLRPLLARCWLPSVSSNFCGAIPTGCALSRSTLKLAKVGLAKVSQHLNTKIGHNRPIRVGQNQFGQSRSIKVGQSRSNFSGQSRFGQSRIWPKSENKDGQVGLAKVGLSQQESRIQHIEIFPCRQATAPAANRRKPPNQGLLPKPSQRLELLPTGHVSRSAATQRRAPRWL